MHSELAWGTADMDSLRLGYLVPEFPGQTHIMFWREVCALRESGARVSIISTRKPDPHGCRHEFAVRASHEAHYVYPPRWIRSVATLLLRPIGLVRAGLYVMGLRESTFLKRLRSMGLIVCAADLLHFCARERIQHIHVHSCADAAHVAALCHRMGGPRYSLTLHGDLPVYGVDHRSKAARASFIATDGRQLARPLIQVAHYPAQRIIPTCMGVDTDSFAVVASRRPPTASVHLVTVARLHQAKGHIHALRAMKQAIERGCELRYTIAGDGPHRAEIARHVELLGLANSVSMPGTLGDQEVRNLLNAADIFVLPSTGLGEAFPISVMEAMSAGLPVISSIIGATPDMITHGVDGILVPQKDEEALAGAIAELACNPDRRLQMGEAARRTAQARFDVRKTAALLLSAITTTIDGRTTNAAGRTTAETTSTLPIESVHA